MMGVAGVDDEQGPQGGWRIRLDTDEYVDCANTNM
jgi:hypothetical protein